MSKEWVVKKVILKEVEPKVWTCTFKDEGCETPFTIRDMQKLQRVLVVGFNRMNRARRLKTRHDRKAKRDDTTIPASKPALAGG